MTDERTTLELAFPGESEMARLSRAYDWASTPLGPVDGWPPCLTVTVRNLITARSPMLLFWGPDLIQFYNDAFRPSLGDHGRHPDGLGALGASFWVDAWDAIGLEINGVLLTGVATWHEDVYIPIDRNGRRDDVWWTYGYSPVFTESGKIGGVLVVCQETTRRVLAEHAGAAQAVALESDHMRLAAIFEHAPSFLALLRDPDHTFVLANPAYQLLIGNRDIIGKTCAEAMPEVRKQGFIELLDNVRETGEPFEGQQVPVALARRPGSPLETRYLNFVYQRLRETDGAYAIIAHGVDVTDEVVSVRELRESQAKLERSHKHLRDLIDGVGPTMFLGLLTPEGIIVEANRSALEAAGLQPDDVLGKPFVESAWWAYSSEEQERLRETIARAVQGEASRYDTQVRGVDGSLIDIDFSLEPLRNEAGHVVFLIPSGSVITERKATENALRESTDHFDLLANNITDVFWIRSADMQEVLYLSPGFERIWGVSADTFYANPQRWTDFIVAEDRERIRIAFDELTRDAPAVDVEHRIARPDGQIRWLRTRGFQVRDAAGKVVRLTGIVTDITEKRTLESQLMVSDRLASVGTLAAGVAHEINNPLAAVIANLDYIAEGLARKSNPPAGPTELSDALTIEDIRGPLADARDAAQRVRFIVRDLKVFSRSPAEEANGPVGVNETMESSVAMAWNEIRHRARLIKEYGDVPPVEANEARLGQVFLNLLVNAAQSLPDGNADHSKIRIRTRRDGAQVLIEVSDTGTGIPPAIIGRIFDAFFTTKAVGAGMGLGLAISQRIVTDMGGKLTVESKVGCGTTFRVALPIARREASTSAPINVTAKAATRRVRILVVDDEAPVASIVQRLLAKEHDVVTAIVATEALAMCTAGEKFDLILCDLMMPEMTGMELYHELMLVAPDQADRMIFMTGGAFTDSARVFLTEPPKEYIEKPFDAANLRAMVQRHLQ